VTSWLSSPADDCGAAAGAALVHEIVFDSGDGFIYQSGRFCAEWRPAGASARVERGPTGVLPDEAIAWARSRSPVVIVCEGERGARYSAGVEQPLGERLPIWPPA